MKRALPPGTDPFTYAAQTQLDHRLHHARQRPPRPARAQPRTARAREADAGAARSRRCCRSSTSRARPRSKGSRTPARSSTSPSLNQPAVVMAVPVVDDDQSSAPSRGWSACAASPSAFAKKAKATSPRSSSTATAACSFTASRRSTCSVPTSPICKIVQDFEKAPVRLTESYDDDRERRARQDARHRRAGRPPDWGVVVQKPEKQAYASVDQDDPRHDRVGARIALACRHRRRDPLRVRHRPPDPRCSPSARARSPAATTSSASS